MPKPCFRALRISGGRDSAMIDIPVFPVRNIQGFYEQLAAGAVAGFTTCVGLGVAAAVALAWQ